MFEAQKLIPNVPVHETQILKRIVAKENKKADGSVNRFLVLSLSDGTALAKSINGGALKVCQDLLREAGIGADDFGVNLEDREIKINVEWSLDEENIPRRDWKHRETVHDAKVAATLFKAA